ncbi:MAG: B12-binding domain-containing radical SAM protein [Desulfuromonadales bacterium]|nr:B12-binding domain-containing radical SAM protein [Desulfuromonadales bacterium]
MRIILVAVHPYPSPQAVPLANAFLQSYRKAFCNADSSVEVVLRDYFLGQEPSDCVADLAVLNPALIGFSLYVWNREQCRSIAEGIRLTLPDVRFFAGGPEATANPGGLLTDEPFDFLIVGEGEQTFADVCEHCAAGNGVSGIPGVATRENGALLLTPRFPVTELDTIPSPWLTGTLDASLYRGILWQLSRGCTFACDYCFDSRGESGVRRFSLERVAAELRHFAENDVSQIFVLDSTFNQDARRAKAILRLIKQIAPGIHFHFEVRCECIDQEMAQLFGEISCSLQIGLQSSDPDVLKGVGRKFSSTAFKGRVALLNESGAVFGFDLMYGLPGDSMRGFCESIDFALALYPNHMDIFPLAILPGTVLAGRSDALGLQRLSEPPYTLLSSPTFSPAELLEARRLTLACDVFYTRGKAVAWFNSVIAVLGMKPSAFLNQFGLWLSVAKGENLSEDCFDDHEIWLLQRSFLAELFRSKKLKRFLPLVLDLVDYHHHYAAALLTSSVDPPDDQTLEQMQLLELSACLAPATRLAMFHYEIMDILEAGEPNIRVFTDHAVRSGSWAVIYPRVGGVCAESLIEPYYRLLEHLDGHTPCGTLADALGIPDDEAQSFLEFVAAEGIALFQPVKK